MTQYRILVNENGMHKAQKKPSGLFSFLCSWMDVGEITSRGYFHTFTFPTVEEAMKKIAQIEEANEYNAKCLKWKVLK